jgi:hypothetical protein
MNIEAWCLTLNTNALWPFETSQLLASWRGVTTLRQHRCENLKLHMPEADEKRAFERWVNSRLFDPAGGGVGKVDQSVVTGPLASPEMRISAEKYAKLAMFWHKMIHIYYNPNINWNKFRNIFKPYIYVGSFHNVQQFDLIIELGLGQPEWRRSVHGVLCAALLARTDSTVYYPNAEFKSSPTN